MLIRTRKQIKKIPVVDSQDKHLLNEYVWTYAKQTGFTVRCNKKTLYLHRLIVGALPGYVVDHINHDNTDNRRENLRICTQSQNSKNQRKPKNNTTGFKGVLLDPRQGLKKRWRATIKVNRRRISLGYYLTAEDAAMAYDKAAQFYFGEFASLNFTDKTKNDQSA